MQTIERDLPLKCRNNAEIIESIDKEVELCLEELEVQCKKTGSDKIIASFEAVKLGYTDGLKKSHVETKEFYENAAEEQDRLFASL